MYSLKKRDPYNKYSIKHKTNMGQPHSNCRPRESMADSPAPSPQPRPCPVALGAPTPSVPVGSAGQSAQAGLWGDPP